MQLAAYSKKENNRIVETTGTAEGRRSDAPEDLRQFLRRKYAEGVTQTELSNAIDYDASYISRYLSGERKEPGLRFMIGVAWYFDIPLYTVIRMAGYDVPRDPNELSLTERQLVNAYRRMSDSDQGMLMRIALGFARDAEDAHAEGNQEDQGSLDE